MKPEFVFRQSFELAALKLHLITTSAAVQIFQFPVLLSKFERDNVQSDDRRADENKKENRVM